MVYDLIVTKSDDGVTAVIPNIKGIDCWAHNEDDAMNEAIQLLCYYLKFEDSKHIKIDVSRKENGKTIYKLIFNKEVN